MQKTNLKSIPGKVLTAKKLFVLDTNVLVHDPRSLFKFKEHDIYISIYTLEELDKNKRGMSEVARNARQASRFLDSIVKDYQGSIPIFFRHAFQLEDLKIKTPTWATPTIIFLEQGREVFGHQGYMSPKEFYKALGFFKTKVFLYDNSLSCDSSVCKANFPFFK